MTDEQQKIERLVRNVPNMSRWSFGTYFGNPGRGPHTITSLQAFARERMEIETEPGVKLLNIDSIYDDAEGNDELLVA